MPLDYRTEIFQSKISPIILNICLFETLFRVNSDYEGSDPGSDISIESDEDCAEENELLELQNEQDDDLLGLVQFDHFFIIFDLE